MLPVPRRGDYRTEGRPPARPNSCHELFGPIVDGALAQSFPTRPVTFVAAGPAGGPTDAIGRIVAEGMRPALGQVILIENVAASGGTAVRKVGHANPDGYTIELGHWGTNVVDGAAMSLPFDLLTDFEPIALIATNPLLITSRKDLPAARREAALFPRH
jgi:tripartite-type tricarboxylate transporter receptor subunit TctC